MSTISEVVYAIAFGKADTTELDKAEKAAIASGEKIEDLRKRLTKEAIQRVRDEAKNAIQSDKKVAEARKKIEDEVTSEITRLRKDALKTIESNQKESRKKFVAEWKSAGASLSSALKKTAIAVSGAAAGLAAFTVHTAAQIDELNNWATTLGTTTQQIQRLEHAGSQVGATADHTRNAIKNLDERLGEMARKGTGPAVEGLRDLGLRLDELNGLTTEEKFAKISDAFAGVEDQSKRVSIAMELMGEEGRVLLPLFQQGGDAVRKYGVEAEALGKVLSKEAVAGAVEFNTQVGDMKALLGGIAAEIGTAAIPELRKWIDLGRGWIAQNRELIAQKIKEYVEGFANALSNLAKVAIELVKDAKVLTDSVGGVENAVKIAAVSFGVLKLAMLGIPGIAFGVGVALGKVAIDLLGVTESIDAARAAADRADRRLAASKKGKTGQDRILDLSPVDLARMSDEEFDRVIEEVITGGAGNRMQADTAVRLADRKRRQGKKLIEQNRDVIAESKDFLVGASAGVTAPTKKKGGAKDKFAKADLASGETEFGAELDRLAETFGASATAVREAKAAGGSSLRGGDNRGVARNAALSRLGSSVGADLTTKSSDPLFSEIFGEDVPDLELSAIARGATPSVLISNITNNFTFDIDNMINGSGDPAAVGASIGPSIRESFEGSIKASTKTAKVVFAR